MQSDSELESIVLKFDQMTSKMERQIDQLHLKNLSLKRENITWFMYNHTIISLSEAFRGIPTCEYCFMNQQRGQLQTCCVKVKQAN